MTNLFQKFLLKFKKLYNKNFYWVTQESLTNLESTVGGIGLKFDEYQQQYCSPVFSYRSVAYLREYARCKRWFYFDFWTYFNVSDFSHAKSLWPEIISRDLLRMTTCLCIIKEISARWPSWQLFYQFSLSRIFYLSCTRLMSLSRRKKRASSALKAAQNGSILLTLKNSLWTCTLSR